MAKPLADVSDAAAASLVCGPPTKDGKPEVRGQDVVLLSTIKSLVSKIEAMTILACAGYWLSSRFADRNGAAVSRSSSLA